MIAKIIDISLSQEKGRYFMTKKKTLLIVPVIFIMSIIISLMTPVCAYAEGENYEPRLTAPNSSIPYYSRELNYYFQTGTGMPNCVAYAFGRVYEMNGERPLIDHGSAGDWWGINKRNGYYEYGSTPKLGAVACWSRHVAVVEKINADGSVTLSESHWGGKYFDTVTYKNMYSHYGQAFYGYIYTYNNGLSKSLEKKLLKAGNEKNASYTADDLTISTEDRFSDFKLNESIQTSKANDSLFLPQNFTK